MQVRIIAKVRQVVLCFIIIFIGAFSSSSAADGQTELWRALGSGSHFVILRHAIAPGVGDPQEFDLDDCPTQRNLSEEGRRQAEIIGHRFRSQGFKEARVFSSQWCRCIETAELLNLGKVNELPVLNSFFGDYEKEGERTRQLKEWLWKQDLSRMTVLVSHQVNITALTGVYPRSGELTVVERTDKKGFVVKGTLMIE